MNFIFPKDEFALSTIPCDFFESKASSKMQPKIDKKVISKLDSRKSPDMECPDIGCLIESNPSKKQVIEYYKSRIASLIS